MLETFLEAFLISLIIYFVMLQVSVTARDDVPFFGPALPDPAVFKKVHLFSLYSCNVTSSTWNLCLGTQNWNSCFYKILHILQPLMFIYEVFGLLNILSDANKCKQVLLVQPPLLKHFLDFPLKISAQNVEKLNFI